MANNIGIERLCVFGMPPVPFVHLAADLGCRFIGIGLTAMRYYNPHGYPDWSLKDDAALRRDMLAAMRDRDVTIALCEGFSIRPGVDFRDQAADLDIVHALGGQRINVVSSGRDRARALDGFAVLTEMAAERRIEVTSEIGMAPVSSLAAGLAAMRHVARPNFKLLLDTMHFFRLGGTVAEVAAADPGAIGYVQLCDAPLVSAFPTYMEEALHDRLAPGSGALPLRELLAVLPRDLVYSIEVPQRALAESGMDPAERVGLAVKAARTLLMETQSTPDHA